MRQTMIFADWSDFPTRVVTTLIGAPLILAAIIFGMPFFDVMIFGFAVVAAVEITRMLQPTNGIGLTFILVSTGLMMAFIVYFTPHLFLCPVLLMILAAFSAVYSFWRGSNPREAWLHNTLYPVMAVLYIGVPMGLLILIRHSPGGLLWIMSLTLTIWATDTMALVGGRAIGRHKLAPQISPSKTIEGALVGIASGIAIGLAVLTIAGKPIGMAMSLSATVAGMTVVGDLLESWLKRRFHVKDASNILPGHGGMMDRLDGFLGAVPFFYVLLLAFAVL